MGKKDWKKLWEEEVTDEHLMKYEGAGIRYTFYDSSENYHIDNEGVSTSNFFSYTIIEHSATSHHLNFQQTLSLIQSLISTSTSPSLARPHHDILY